MARRAASGGYSPCTVHHSPPAVPRGRPPRYARFQVRWIYDEVDAQRNDPAPVDEEKTALHQSGVRRLFLERENRPCGQGQTGNRGERRVQLPAAFRGTDQRKACPKTARKATPLVTWWTWAPTSPQTNPLAEIDLHALRASARYCR